jgi:hypothetical protein
MANTTYREVFEMFEDKITDYELAGYDENLRNELLTSYMNNACRRFNRICTFDLSDRNNDKAEFNSELGESELDIITEWMVVFWLKPIVNDTDNLHNRINTAEFSSVSPANMLLAIKDVYETSRKQVTSLMNQYSYLHSELDRLKP